MAVAGASRFMNASMLANLQGRAASLPNLFTEGGFAGMDLLTVGRNNSVPGIGISPSARALNKQFIEQNSSTFNQIFSLGAGADATVEGARQQILAMRARLSDSQLAPSLRGVAVDQEA